MRWSCRVSPAGQSAGSHHGHSMHPNTEVKVLSASYRVTVGIKFQSEMLNSVHAGRGAKKFSLIALQIQLVPVCWESSWFAVWSGLWNIDSKMLAGEIVLRSCPCVWQTENKEEEIRQCCISGLHKPPSSSMGTSETILQWTSHPQEWQHI